MGIFKSLFGESHASNKCRRCGSETLGTFEYTQRCKEEGAIVDGLTGKPKPAQTGRPINISRLTDLENQRGFQCIGSNHIYCMDCLYNHAPIHPNGGKACFKCGSSFEEMR